MPSATELAAIVAVKVTLPEPSKDTLPVRSPASPMSLAFVYALAVLATLEEAEADIPFVPI